MSRPRRERQRGSILLAVVLALGLVAAVAFLLNRDGSMGAELVAGSARADEARYVAEAGLAHATWQAQRANCIDYEDVPATDFGMKHSYAATVAPTSGSPVTIVATGTLADGTSHTTDRTGVVAYETPATLVLQPGAADGKDTYLNAWKADWNWGASKSLKVRNSGSLQHSLLMFDVSSVYPQARIVSAELELHQNSASALGGTVGVRRVTRDWAEGTMEASSGDASWNEADAGVPWGTPGGDFGLIPEATADLAPATVGWFQWDVTGLVSDWVGGAQPNRGLALVPESPNIDVGFSSSEGVDPSRHPKLTIVYVCECSVGCSGFYRDEFNSQTCDPAVDYTGSDGTLDWSPWTWTEIGESQDSCAAGVRIENDLGDLRVRIAAPDKGVERAADLSSFNSAWLHFDYRRSTFDAATDLLVVSASGNGGTDWTEVAQIAGPADDATYQSADFDISAFLGPDTVIRFTEQNTFSGSEIAYIDNVQIDNDAGTPSPSVTLTPEADSFIEQDLAANHGGDDWMRFNKFGEDRPLLRFDVSALPPGALVDSALLRLWVVSHAGGPSATLDVHGALEFWEELEVQWFDRIVGTSWSTAGGEYQAAVAGSTTLPGGFENDWLEIDIAPLVQEWVDGVTPNEGVILLAAPGKDVLLASREEADPALRPQLVVSYTP
jgi:hypothetical protein